MSNFYADSARKQFGLIAAAKAQTRADLEMANANDDKDLGAELVQRLADIDAQEASLIALHNRYVASQTPPPPLSREEQMAKPWDRMDYDDALQIARTSKYGRGLSHDDPNVRAGYAEVIARRQRGE